MRAQLVAIVATAFLFVPQMSRAQHLWLPTAQPPITATRAPWQVNGEAIFYQGGFYYPTGPTEFFDGFALVRTGDYQGVPLYENRFLEQYSIVYVPVSGGQMRPYERRRYGQFSGPASRTPWFPLQHDVELSLGVEEPAPDRFRIASGGAQWDWPEPEVARPQPALTTSRQAPGASPSVVIRAVPQRDTTNAGAFVRFGGAQYFTSGKAVRPDPQAFTRVGEAAGAAVYRAVRGDQRTIFVEAVPGGALAPYSRR